MSFGDLYTVQPGQDVGRGLPPVELPRTDEPPPPGRREPLRITVHPSQRERPWLESAPDWTPPAASKEKGPTERPWLETAPDWTPSAAGGEPVGDISGPEAFGRSLAHGATFGLAPALQGVAAAGGPAPTDIAGRASAAAAQRPIVGALNMLAEYLGIHPGETAWEAYHRGRSHAQAELEAGEAQHPIASLAGEMTGAVLGPGVGGFAAVPANIGGRIARGAAAGGLGGGLYGGGSAISKGESLEDIGREAATGATGGAIVGGAFGGLLGPRFPQAITPGQRAAQTAEALGAPLPRGVTFDSPFMQSTTSRMRQLPFVGERIGQRVEATQEAAGRRIGDIASGGAGVAPDRALTGSMLRPALQGVIDDNNLRIDQAYQGLRRLIDPDRATRLTRTERALGGILRERAAAGMRNPEAGLGDIINLADNGAGFNGLQRARNEVGRLIGLAQNNPNPGFNVGDFKRLYAAMSGDMDTVVRRHALYDPNRAADALRYANRAADQLVERNKAVQGVLNVRADERLVGSLINAAQQKTGNLRLLAQLRNSMHPDDFREIGGVMLTEMGHMPATGEFSLAKFVTNWDKVSDRAKGLLFSPEHLQNINDIAGMGEHIKRALKESSTSHSANMLVLLDVAKDVALLTMDLGTGAPGFGTAAGAASTAVLYTFARWLGNPSTTSSMAAWARARNSLIASPTPGRVAAFNVATRQLADKVGVDPSRILAIAQHTQGAMSGRTEDENPEAPRIRGNEPNRGQVGGKDQSRFH